MKSPNIVSTNDITGAHIYADKLLKSLNIVSTNDINAEHIYAHRLLKAGKIILGDWTIEQNGPDLLFKNVHVPESWYKLGQNTDKKAGKWIGHTYVQ